MRTDSRVVFNHLLISIIFLFGPSAALSEAQDRSSRKETCLAMFPHLIELPGWQQTVVDFAAGFIDPRKIVLQSELDRLLSDQEQRGLSEEARIQQGLARLKSFVEDLNFQSRELANNPKVEGHHIKVAETIGRILETMGVPSKMTRFSMLRATGQSELVTYEVFISPEQRNSLSWVGRLARFLAARRIPWQLIVSNNYDHFQGQLLVRGNAHIRQRDDLTEHSLVATPSIVLLIRGANLILEHELFHIATGEARLLEPGEKLSWNDEVDEAFASVIWPEHRVVAGDERSGHPVVDSYLTGSGFDFALEEIGNYLHMALAAWAILKTGETFRLEKILQNPEDPEQIRLLAHHKARISLAFANYAERVYERFGQSDQIHRVYKKRHPDAQFMISRLHGSLRLNHKLINSGTDLQDLERERQIGLIWIRAYKKFLINSPELLGTTSKNNFQDSTTGL